MSKAEDLGMTFAPFVGYSLSQEKGGNERWVGTVTIGSDTYYETDPHKEKADAVAEMIGYLCGAKYNIENVINNLNKE